MFFYGVHRDPVRNVWIVEAGMIACAGIVPPALICGPVRGIPIWWSVIDMSFGVFGVIPLLILRRMIKRLEAMPAPGEGDRDHGEGALPRARITGRARPVRLSARPPGSS